MPSRHPKKSQEGLGRQLSTTMIFVNAILAVVCLIASFILAYVVVDAVMSKHGGKAVGAGIAALFSAFACLIFTLDVFFPGVIAQLMHLFG